MGAQSTVPACAAHLECARERLGNVRALIACTEQQGGAVSSKQRVPAVLQARASPLARASAANGAWLDRLPAAAFRISASSAA